MPTDLADGRYLSLGLIATGTVAEVHRCRLSGPRGFAKLVARKTLLPRWARDPVAVADFIDEARLGGLLSHENIAQVFDFGESVGGYFLAMEYLHGRDLLAVMRRAQALQETIPAGLALYIAGRICAGLAYAHQLKDQRQRPLNLVHRELSPDNIVITCQGRVKIIDFGCARADLFEERTRMGMVKGQIPYMAPEQLTGAAVDQRADIFAIGILLYEMLSGRRLYPGDPETLAARCRKAEWPGMASVAGRLPPAVCAVVDRALQPDPQLRYPSCGQMQAEIDACLAAIEPRPNSQQLGRYLGRLFAADQDEKKRPGRPVLAAPEEEGEDGLVPVEAPAGATGAAAPARRPRLIRPALRLAAGAVFLMLAIFLLVSDMAEEEKIPTGPVEPAIPPAEAPSPAPPGQAPAVGAAASAKPAEQPARRMPDGRAKKIDDLLAQAAEAWQDGRLTEPDKDCAFWVYSRILALDPKHVEAWRGLERITAYYGDRAEQALGAERYQEAERWLQKGLQVFPDNRRLIALRGEMEAHVEQYIAELAGKAERALRRDNLTTPVEAAAYTYYQKILKLDKRNKAALAGIDSIADRYAELAEQAYRNLQLANCREFVNSGLAVAPHHPKLVTLQEDLNRSMPGIFFKSLEKSLSTLFE